MNRRVSIATLVLGLLGLAGLAAPTPASAQSALGVVEQRLADLRYYVGHVDGIVDEETAHGVTAFQKVEGLPRTGAVDAATWEAMVAAQPPAPLVPGGAGARVEVDVARQVLFLYQGGALAVVLPVSTGSEVPYCENGSCGDAVTPPGDFEVYRVGSGWEHGPLGSLYNPLYFNGGIAIHGATSVPPEPASHGCVRIPMGPAEWFPHHVGVGTPVHVRWTA
jgi:lipoprotein-anchoring transpeptidase ErfK/SrfK